MPRVPDAEWSEEDPDGDRYHQGILPVTACLSPDFQPRHRLPETTGTPLSYHGT